MRIKRYTGTPCKRRLKLFYYILPESFEGGYATRLYIDTFYSCKDIAYRDLAALYQSGRLTRHKLPTDKRRNVYEKV